MKYIFLITAILFMFSIHAQKIQTIPKANHSFYLGVGGFAEGAKRNYSGFSSSISYQVYFPNRFIFGIEYLMDQSIFKASYGPDENLSYSSRVKSQSGTIHLGVHIFRKEHFDLSIMIVPQVNYQKYFTKIYDKEKDEYTFRNHHTTYVFIPLLAYRLESFYKFNQQHAIGFTVDLGVGSEFEDISASPLGLVRGMVHYRFTIPNR